MRNKAFLLFACALLLAGVLLFLYYSTMSQVPEQVSTVPTEPDREPLGGAVVGVDSAESSESTAITGDELGDATGETISEEELPASESVLEPQDGAWIRGHVTDADGGAIANAEILLGMDFEDGGNFRTLSGVDGAFEIGGLAKAQYLIGARRPGYAPAFVRAAASQTRGVSVRLVLSRGGSLEGHVTLAGEPLSNCRVGAFHVGDSTSGQTDVWPDESGFYRMEALTPGPYELELVMGKPATGSVAKPRIISARVVIEEGRTTQADFDFSVVRGSLEGQITVAGVAPKKAAITLALVREDEERLRGKADSDGFYRFEEVGFGLVRLHVRAESLEGRIFFTSRSVSVAEGEHGVLNIELLSGSQIAGRVSGLPEDFEAGVIVLPGEVEVEEVSIEVMLDLYQTAVVVVDPIGGDEFQATGLEAGTYTVLVLAVKQTTSDPFGDMMTGSYIVELGEGDEAYIEHSFEGH